MNEQETKEIRDNIISGLDETFTKLINEKKRSNSELAFEEGGKVVKVKAVEI